MTTFYHATEGLGLGHTFPIGRPWVSGSTLEYVLVCLPYPFGPELERFSEDGVDVQVVWLLPITAAERKFNQTAGLEALEQLFEDRALVYWSTSRESVVA